MQSINSGRYARFCAVLVLCLLATMTTAQVRQATCYDLRAGHRLKVEEYDRAGRKVRESLYEYGKLATVTTLDYDALGRRVRSVRTDVQADPPWDYIEEWSYDEAGRETFWLWGNNRTGRWGSTVRLYDAAGRLAEQRHFLKNGQLDYTLRMAYEQRGDTLDEWAYNVPADTLYLTTVLSYRERKIGDAERPRRTQYFDAEGALQHEYTYRYDAVGRVTEEAFFLGGVQVLTMYYRYDKQGRLMQQRIRDGAVESVMTCAYNERGDLVREQTKGANGRLEGERWVYLYW